MNTETWGNPGIYLKFAEVANPGEPVDAPIIHKGVELRLYADDRRSMSVELGITNYDDPHGATQLRVNLTRETINKMIRELRGARNRVFGVDE